MKNKFLHLLTIVLLLGAILCGALAVTASADETAPAPAASIDYFALSVEERGYFIEYAVKYTGFEPDKTNVGMLFWTSEPEDGTFGTQNSLGACLGYSVIDGETYYIYQYNDLKISQLCDVIWARAYAVINGTYYYSNTVKYSVTTYAERKLGLVEGVAGSGDDALKTALKAMLEYGAAAQIKLGYNTDRLPTDILPESRLTVSFDTDGGNAIPEQTVLKNHRLTDPGDPTREGYTFAGWYNGDRAWVFEANSVTETITLTAKWTKNDTHTHEWENVWSHDKLTHWFACASCDAKQNEDVHAWSNWVIEEPAGCETDGKKVRTCLCGAREEIELPATGHKPSSDLQYSDRAEDGHWHVCGTCGAKLDQAAHNIDGKNPTILRAATCTESGLGVFFCKDCGYSEERDIPTAGHTPRKYVRGNYLKSGATCTHAAVYYMSCAVCEEALEDTFEAGEAVNHDFSDMTVRPEALKEDATCMSAARYYKSCRWCGQISTMESDVFEYGGSVDHVFDLCLVKDIYLAQAATCSSPASYYKSCRWCGLGGLSDDTFVYGDVRPHDLVVLSRTPATCTQNGNVTYECRYNSEAGDCSYRIEMPDPDAPPTGHDVKGMAATETQIGTSCEYSLTYTCRNCGGTIDGGGTVWHHHYVASITREATCLEAGEKSYKCSSCGDTSKASEAIPADPTHHNWVEGTPTDGTRTDTCAICGETKTVKVFGGNIGYVDAGDLKDSEVELVDAFIKLDDGLAGSLTGDVKVSADKLVGEDRDSLKLTPEQLEQLGDNPVYNFTLVNGDNKLISNFGDNCVTVRLPYTLAEGEDVDSIAIWYIDGNGKLTSVKGTYSNGYVTFETDHFSYYTVTRLTPRERCELYGHSYASKNVPGSCTEDAYTLNVCVRCHDTVKTVTTPAPGHQFRVTTEVPVGCTTNGRERHWCLNCGYEFFVMQSATGHKWNLDAGKSEAATCEHPGRNIYTCGNGCGEILEEELEQLPHTYGNETVVSETCETEGYTVRTCEICSHVEKTNIVPPTRHNWSLTWEWSTDRTEATAVFTCMNDAQHERRLTANVTVSDSVDYPCCDFHRSVCMATVAFDNAEYYDIKNVGDDGEPDHIFGAEWKSDEWMHWHECACGIRESEASHDWQINEVPATCTEDGYRDYVCATCGYSRRENTGKAFGHDYAQKWAWAEDNASAVLTLTCAHGGDHAETYPVDAAVRVITVACSDYTRTIYTVTVTVGTEVYTDTHVVEAGTPGHRFAEVWSRDGATHWHECACGARADEAAHNFDTETVITPATCVDAGKAIRTCICGETQTVVLRATGVHDYRNGVCTGCGKEESDCDHKILHEETLILGSHGEDGDSTLVYKTCECGEVKIFLMEKSHVLCSSKDQTMNTWTDEDGTMHAHMEMTCDICGVLAAADATMRTTGCTRKETYVYTFSRDGKVLIDNLTVTNSYTNHVNTEMVTIDLKKEYNACGGTVRAERCTKCGEIVGFGMDGGFRCNIELDETFFTVPTDTYVDENGFEHRIYSRTCPDCGLTIAVEEWTEVYSVCESGEYSIQMLRMGDTVIAKMQESNGSSTHEWETSYKLLGETCEDGVQVTESCPKCGAKHTYTTNSHIIDSRITDSATFGICEGEIYEDYCVVCKTLTGAYVDTACHWRYDIGEDGQEILTCTKCGAVRTVTYTEAPTSDPCTFECTALIVYTKDGTELYRIEEHSADTRHDYNEEYVLKGETCEDGVLVTQICRKCGEEDSYTTHGHIQSDRAIDTQKLGMCKGSIDEEYCLACGTVLWINENTVCKWEETGVSGNTRTLTCQICGAVKTVTQSETEPDDECLVEFFHRITITVSGKEVYSFAETYTTTQHDYEETVRFEEGKTCEDGYYLVYTCRKCGDEYEKTRYGHRDLEELIIQGEGTCGYSISIEVCKICGTVLYMNIYADGCTWTAVDPTTYVDADGYTHTVTDKTCSVCGIRVKEDKWTIPDEKYPQCAGVLYTITTLTLADGTTYEHKESLYTNSHRFQHQYTLNNPDEGCNGGYLEKVTCTICGYETDLRTEYQHRYQNFVLNLADSGCCEGTLSGRICGICHRLLDTCDWQIECDFGVPTTETVTDENGVEHTVQTKACKTCGLTTVVDSWKTERDGCYSNGFAKMTIRMGEDVLLEFVRQEVEENHTWGEWSYEFDDEDLRCAGSFRAIRTCSKCNNRNERWYNHHLTEEQEIQLEELGLCAGSATISTCRVCGKVVSGRINFSMCQWETIPDEATGEWITKCGVCGVVRKSVYTEVKGEHCIVTAETYTSYQKDGVEVLRIGGLDIWKSHTYVATFDKKGESCTDGYTVHRTCADCGDTLPDETRNEHDLEIVFRLEKIGTCGEKHVILVYSCACGEHTSISRLEGLTHDNDGRYKCDTCGLCLTNSFGIVNDGCNQTIITQILVVEGETILFSQDHVTTKVVHTFGTPTATVENGTLTMTTTCEVCHAERVSTRKMTYESAELTEHDEGWYFKLSFAPTESGLYTIESFTEGDTYVELYQLIDGTLVLIGWDDDSAGYANFRLTYRLEAGQSYVYRIRFLDNRKSGTISYTLNRTGDVETGAECEHSTKIFRIFAEGSTSCEDGVLSVEWCTACGALMSVSESHEHLTEGIWINLGEKGACWGELVHEACLCGKQERVYYKGCADTMTENVYTEDGRTVHVTVYACNSCGTRYEVRWYTERDASTCKETRTYIVTLNIGTESVFDLTYTDTFDSHDIEETISYINDGSTSCEDGVLVIEICRDCGEELNRYTTSSHHMTVIERIDLTACGSTCPGEAVLRRCLCGERTSVELEDAQCKFDISGEASWIEGALSGSVRTADGDSYFYSNAIRYTCTQTNPACGFLIRQMTYWMRVDGECKAVQHEVWQFGYNPEDGTCAKEIDFLTGEERAYHAYNVTHPDNNSTHYDCPACGSYYYRDVTVDENGNTTKEETTALTKYSDGTYATRHEVTEYTTDDSAGRYWSYRLLERVYADGRTYSLVETQTPYADVSFGSNGFKATSETRQNGEITRRQETAYTWYRDNRYDLYEYVEESNFWCRFDYTYSFDGECLRTTHYTNSYGEERTGTENCCIGFTCQVIRGATCTQYGEERRNCSICGRLEKTSQIFPNGHIWLYLLENLYVCQRCNMLNANGADGDVVLEDLTAAYGNGTDYVAGCWIRTGVKFTTYVSLIFADGTEVVLPDLTATELEGLNAVRVSKSAVEALAAEKGYEAGSYSVRISFVPDGDDGSHDYGVTFDSKSTEDTVTGNTTVTAVAAGGENQTVTVTIAPEVSGEWFFAYGPANWTYPRVTDSEGNEVDCRQLFQSGWDCTWFELEAGKTYTFTFAVADGYTGTVTLVVIAPEAAV